MRIAAARVIARSALFSDIAIRNGFPISPRATEFSLYIRQLATRKALRIVPKYQLLGIMAEGKS